MVQLVLSTPLRDKSFTFDAKDCMICKYGTVVEDGVIYCSLLKKEMSHRGLFTNYCDEFREDEDDEKLERYFVYLKKRLKPPKVELCGEIKSPDWWR